MISNSVFSLILSDCSVSVSYTHLQYMKPFNDISSVVTELQNALACAGRIFDLLEEGMITSDEPGYYREDEFGIRHENLMVCKKAEKTEYGQFMCLAVYKRQALVLIVVVQLYWSSTDLMMYYSGSSLH